jgi:predicted RND superfamily exporter protein
MTGVLIIVGIALVVAVGGFVLHALFHRFGRSRHEAMTRTPARDGQVGRISEFRDG